MKRFFIPLIILVPILTACGNLLASDITPPPNSLVASPVTAQPTTISSPSYPLVPPRASDGEDIYEEKCAPCHGVNGLGDGPKAGELPNPVSAIGTAKIARQGTPAKWYRVVSEGNLERFMPPFTSLSDRQRWDVVAYTYSLSMNEEKIAEGAELYSANCAGCHGESGKGDGAAASSLQPPRNFTDLEYMASRSTNDFYTAITQGVEPDMPAFADEMSEAERWVISDYIRLMTFAPTGELAGGETAGVNDESLQTPGEVEESVGSDNPEESTSSEMGAVTGAVVNASGGVTPFGATVTLYAFDQMQQVFTQTTTLQDDGRFSFDDVEMPPERVFMATTEYEKVAYGSDIGTAHSDGMILDLPIIVYDTTTDQSTLSIDRLHIFLEQEDEETLRVAELYVISNLGDKTIVPQEEGEAVIVYNLPQGATDLEIQDGLIGERYVLTSDGFGDTINIRPGFGEYQTIFTYLMPLEGLEELSHRVTLPAEALVILAPEGLKVKGEALQEGGVQNIQDVQYMIYSGGSLSAGDEIRLSISGSTPGLGISIENTSSTSLVLGLGMLGVVLIAGGVWLYLRNKAVNGEPEMVEDVSPIDDPDPDNVETIMDAIIALDDLYREGELPKEAYIKRRGELKDQLKGMTGEK